MKKLTAVILIFAVIFCFAACTKGGKGEIYEPPVTEVISFEDGVTAVFEVVTEENGEVATDAEGETKYIPYIPPVTEKGGYLVTDKQGSTIPDIPTAPAKDDPTKKPNVDSDVADFDETTKANGQTQKPETTTKPQQMDKPETTTKPQQMDKPETTTKPQPQNPTEATTQELDGTLTKAKAQKLVDMIEGIENPFDEDLVRADFYAAEKSLDTYITNVNAVIAQIKADKVLYEFVGNEQLKLWSEYLEETKDMYQRFMTMVEHEEGKTQKNPLYYEAYTDFQESYTGALEIYYYILFAAQDRA